MSSITDMLNQQFTQAKLDNIEDILNQLLRLQITMTMCIAELCRNSNLLFEDNNINELRDLFTKYANSIK